MYLEDTVRIEAPPEKVYHFFKNLESNFIKWHPAHVHFEWTEGEPLQKGSVFQFEEWIFGELQKNKVYFTDVVPNRYLEFAPVNPMLQFVFPKMMFEMEPLGDSDSLFRTRVKVRTGTVGEWIFRKYLDAFGQHLKEECENLKTILENGSL